jgi:hypothetical protein
LPAGLPEGAELLTKTMRHVGNALLKVSTPAPVMSVIPDDIT